MATSEADLESTINQALEDLPSWPSNCSIYRVPGPLRKIKPEAYTPRLVSIGPFHREKQHLQTMEAHKLRYLNDFLDRETPRNLGKYIKAMTKLEKQTWQCYSEIFQSISENEFVKMMLIDGCFILELILRTTEPRHDDESILNATWMTQVIKCDLHQLENQLPFFVLEHLYDLLPENSHYVYELGPLTFSHHVCLFFGDLVLPPQIKTSKSSIFEVAKNIVYAFVSFTRRSMKKDELADEEAPVPKARLTKAAIIKDKEIPRLEKKDQAELVEPLFKKDKEISEEEENSQAKREKEKTSLEESSNVNTKRLLDLLRYLLAEPLFKKDKEISEEEENSQAKREKEKTSVEESSNVNTKHLLDLLRHLLVRSPTRTKKERQNRGKFTFTCCATKLREASVKFEKGETKCLLDIKFKNGVLSIPTMTIEDWTESLLRNLIAFEQSYVGYHQDITYYAAFMDGLIDSPKDVELLEKQGIVECLLGEPKEVADLFNGLLKEVTIIENECYFYSVCGEVDEYYTIPWHKWKASFMHNYCNSPWAIFSFLAATILLILTVVQTICSIIQVS